MFLFQLQTILSHRTYGRTSSSIFVFYIKFTLFLFLFFLFICFSLSKPFSLSFVLYSYMNSKLENLIKLNFITIYLTILCNFQMWNNNMWILMCVCMCCSTIIITFCVIIVPQRWLCRRWFPVAIISYSHVCHCFKAFFLPILLFAHSLSYFYHFGSTHRVLSTQSERERETENSGHELLRKWKLTKFNYEIGFYQ